MTKMNAPKVMLAILSCAAVVLVNNGAVQAIEVRPASAVGLLGVASDEHDLETLHHKLSKELDIDHVYEMIDISHYHNGSAEMKEIKMPTLAQDADHGFCFMMGLEFGSTDSKVQKTEAEHDTKSTAKTTPGKGGTDSAVAAAKSLTIDFGLSLEPDKFGPFFVFHYNFPKSFGQMFSKIASAIDKVMVKIGISPENKAKVKATGDTLKNFAKALGSLKDAAKKSLEKNFPTLYHIFSKFDIGLNTGNRNNAGGSANSNSGNNGWLFDFKFQDTANAGNPSLQIEWRLKNSNELTACCVDLVNPLTGFIPAIAPGTCGWSNQGLHAQGQVKGINWLEALASIVLPVGKTIKDYIVKDAKGVAKPKTIGVAPFAITTVEYNYAQMKTDALARFNTLKGEGGVVGGIMATLANGIANAAATALQDAVFVATLELRVTLFTAGFSGEFKIKDVINKFKEATAALVAKLPKKSG